MKIVQWRKTAYVISAVLVGASALALFLWGFRLGIDFTGGTLLEVQYAEGLPDVSRVETALAGLGLGSARVQVSDANRLLIRMQALSEDEHRAALSALRLGGRDVTELRFDSIGPTIGAELRKKMVTAIVLVLLMIILYITWAFRKVGKPLSSWRYGLVAVAALVHDVTIPSGVFAALGRFANIEIDALFVTALLTVLGFSVHDTIVVFDRVRENLQRRARSVPFAEVVGASIRETLARSINTSLTTMLVLAALLAWGPASTRYLSLALLLGIFFGTYSSIFIASPLLVSWERRLAKKHGIT